MLASISRDIQRTLKYGNAINRVILINAVVFVIILLIRSFLPGTSGNPFYQDLIRQLALPSDGWTLLKKPWTILTHMFVHEGFWHIFWNMLILYWFGQIVGDLINDRRVLPIYFFGGFAGAAIYLIFHAVFLPGTSIAIGASAAVMAIVLAAACTAPDYVMRLILIGPVRIKYIALFLVLIDLVTVVPSAPNSGGHAAHLGGAAFGALFVYLLRNGTDLSDIFHNTLNRIRQYFSKTPKERKSPLTVEHRSTSAKKPRKADLSHQERLDEILDKIKKAGYDQLSDEEKEFLFQASKK